MPINTSCFSQKTPDQLSSLAGGQSQFDGHHTYMTLPIGKKRKKRYFYNIPYNPNYPKFKFISFKLLGRDAVIVVA